MVLIFGALSALLSFVIAFPIRRLLTRYQVLDLANERSLHEGVVVRGGGIAVLISVFIFVGIRMLLAGSCQDSIVAVRLLEIMMILGLVSFLDDVRSLSPALRFFIQAVVACFFLVTLRYGHFFYKNEFATLGNYAELVMMPCSFIWLVGYTNAFNFMDGINGLVSGQAVIAAIGCAIIAVLSGLAYGSTPVIFCAVLAGAVSGFIPHNFPKARMFMGDVGSIPIGFALAALVLWVGSKTNFQVIIALSMLHLNFILDTAATMLRRFVKGEKIYLPHREHFYQRFVRAGVTHQHVSLVEWGLQIVCLLCAIAFIFVSDFFKILLFAGVLMTWLGFFANCERKFRSVTVKQ